MTVNVLGRRLPATATYVVLLGGSLLLLLVSVVAAFLQASHQHDINLEVRRSFEVRSAARQVLISLQDAETGQRGYLLTGDVAYLEPYQRARATTDAQLLQLDVFAQDDPRLHAQVGPLRDLTHQKFAELNQTIDLRRSGRGEAALAIVRVGRGKQVMDQARAVIDRLLIHEGAKLDARLADAESGSVQLRRIVFGAALLLLAIGALLVVTARRAMGELRDSRDAMKAANDRLTTEMDNRRKAEAKIVQMQKMEAIGQLTGGVAHDFNNMLAVIVGAISMIQRRRDRGDGDIGPLLEAAHDAARRASSLTSRLLAFARKAPLSPVALDLNQLVGGMSELLRRTLGETVQMETVLAGGLWPVEADPSQLENAIVNICVNARDAMLDGGKLTIETANAHLDEQYAASTQDVTPGQYALVAISDTGVGMTPEVVARAFEPFFTTKDVGKGTGLGLSHVHGFLKQTGGHVAIYSEIGVGTTVKLYLPRSMKQAAPRPDLADNGPPPVGDPGIVVLVVEDEERVRMMSVASLRELGYTVVHAESGGAALDVLDRTPNVALLFTDVVMPDMSGRALADTARKRYAKLKVLYTTGYTQNAIVHNGVLDSDARLLMKPYSLDQLARKIRAVLDEK